MRRHEIAEKRNGESIGSWISILEKAGYRVEYSNPGGPYTIYKGRFKEGSKDWSKSELISLAKTLDNEKKNAIPKGDDLIVSDKWLKDNDIPLKKGSEFDYRGYRVKLVEPNNWQGGWWARVQ